MIRQYELVERVRSYDPHADEDKLNRAYVFSMKAHGSQKRESGDSYFSHPLEVAGILTHYKLDDDTIVTALLHDTVEDTLATTDELERQFGSEVARLVDGVTKLSRIELQSEASRQAENFRKLLLAMSEDIRVLLVKLADRLHNMRTLKFIRDPERRRRIARETMDIYAPLAERIGMHEIKDELEDLAFAEINPDARESIIARLRFLREQGGGLVTRIIDELRRILREDGLDVEISGREKQPYSIWRKMQKRNVAFEQLSDIMAFRVAVADIGDCYRALGVIHGRYRVVPGRFKDYISLPKPNGYRSLHTGVFGPEKQRIEIQIRTKDMHEVAEYGVAAHWEYKQGTTKDGKQYRWLRELLEILEHAAGPDEFLEHTKLEMFQDQVFCFTPKGDLIALPTGATPVDFAYQIHSQIGDRCVGCKINGRMMPLRTQLKNGDQVEIVTSRTQTPSPEWERFVVTGKARSRVRRFIRTQKRQEYMTLGRSILEKAFRQAGYEFTEKAVESVLKILKSDSADDLIAAVGEGIHTAREVLVAVYPSLKQQSPKDAKIVPIGKARGRRAKPVDNAIPIKGLIPGMAVHFAGCCHPLPGDRIVGLVTTGKGVTIHTIDCETLERYSDTPERWIDVGWDSGASEDEGHIGRLTVVVSNEPGTLGELSTLIGKQKGNITNLRITHRSTDFFEMMVDIEVQDVKHLTNIMAALRASPAINSVERARG
ncbi:MAG TPA: bifunctional (p)ppGpp synthetase/guanosine-3',5'-bis(diphosphate) 3'-pyrophosphohydrolase [Alphaproteobacteria bacterium]|nr:bifunctional (p)ppGpp synthetase/guanosine-3',5'-bis(diphosphate) 3'-pyrophosphohydrolase [Alphaproteobacteria bacterium]